MRWLKEEARGAALFGLIIGTLLLALAYALAALPVLALLKFDLPPLSRERIPIFTFSFPFFLFTVAAVEEIVFRFPLAIAIYFELSLKRVLIVALVLSALFGIAHGGIHNIFIQGVSGFIYSILFLKAGGLQKNYTKALTVTTTMHFLYNMTLVGIVIVKGWTLF